MDSASNLVLIQPEDWARPDAPGKSTPLFLMHDGGGTAFMYTFLPPLNRHVYGISNPRFTNGGTFEGGIPEMARLYSKWILDTMVGGNFPTKSNRTKGNGGSKTAMDVLLGGWSFGGHLSLEIAKQLESDTRINVKGILLVDCPYPTEGHTSRSALPSFTKEEESRMSKFQRLSNQAMDEASRMANKWSVPEFGMQGQEPPRTVLIKARDKIPMSDGRVNPLDLERGPGQDIGWDQDTQGLLQQVTEIDGHHFELFTGPRLETTATAMCRALDYLDSTS